MFTSRTLDGCVGARSSSSAENLQRSGAFKFRGAYNALGAWLPERARARRRRVLVGQPRPGAWHWRRGARHPGAIVMPDDAPAFKLAATKGYGAEIVRYDR